MDGRRSGRALHADIYANHLYVADFGRSWAASVRAEAETEPSALDAEYLRGYAQALTDLSEHFADGDALPGGPLYVRMAEQFASRERSTA